MSCLGRERMFEHFSRTLGIPMAIIRLNYACELRYGVLVDLAQRVWHEQPIDLAWATSTSSGKATPTRCRCRRLTTSRTPPTVHQRHRPGDPERAASRRAARANAGQDAAVRGTRGRHGTPGQCRHDAGTMRAAPRPGGAVADLGRRLGEDAAARRWASRRISSRARESSNGPFPRRF